MKLLNISSLWIFLIIVACNNDDKIANPLDRLPPATQTGQQTFGCLVDGKLFLPDAFGSGRPTAFYQLIDGSYNLGISAHNSESKLIAVAIGGIDINALNEESYTLMSEQSGNLFGKYLVRGGIEYNGVSTNRTPGRLIITHFDPDNFIISGTFNFTAEDSTGAKVQITQGRFDVKYTN